jgi:hypothetical protein
MAVQPSVDSLDVDGADLLARLNVACPAASAFELGVPEVTPMGLRDMSSPQSAAYTWSIPARPWPNVVVSPDSNAYAYLTVIDSPPQLFVSSRIDSIGYANYEYLGSWHLLDAAWLDEHRFLLILAPHEVETLRLQLSVGDLRTRTKLIWHPSYDGTLPTASSITARVAAIEAAAEEARAARRSMP